MDQLLNTGNDELIDASIDDTLKSEMRKLNAHCSSVFFTSPCFGRSNADKAVTALVCQHSGLVKLFALFHNCLSLTGDNRSLVVTV